MSTSFFQGAHDFQCHEINISMRAADNPDPSFELLRSEIADGAMHDSAERSNPPTCHAETRKAVQEDIFSWIAHEERDADRPKTVLWMSGPAGCGKTAIAGSVAEMCEERGILAASFFFSSVSGSPRRRRKRFLIPTLAYQLMQADVTGRVREHILSSIRRDPAILRKALKYQCRTLLLKPFIDNPPQTHIKVIVIDGLDEVESELSGGPLGEITRLQILRANQDDQVEILEALLPIVTNPAFPFRLFLVSRPERAIREFFTSRTAIQVTHELFLDGKYNPDADIELFLRSKFSDIRRRYRLPGSWPADESIKTLVSNASGQFVYATTIIRFVEDGTRTPPDQLVRALQMQPMDADNPLEPLYALYQHILNQSPDPTFASQWILLAAGLHYFRLPDMPARYCKLLLETSPGQEELLLGNLSSLVCIPASEDTSSRYQVYHKSLGDYLRSIIGPRVLQEVRCRCYIRILENKGPVVPITPAETQHFLDAFIRDWQLCLEVAFNRSDRALSAENNAYLAQCDVSWWMHQIVMRHPLGEAAAVRVSNSFYCAHMGCDYDAGTCTARCYHWRACILAFCQANGWTTPTKADLIRERMHYDERGPRRGEEDDEDNREELHYDEDDYDTYGDFTFIRRFRLPQRGGSIVPSPRGTM
ncbi:hypothetical protein NMY22_g4070 [Coprinellus aureogranulatus]|nr:hypothetical protein NMY22_g4070 [Coprinellus aureogranulatus]